MRRWGLILVVVAAGLAACGNAAPTTVRAAATPTTTTTSSTSTTVPATVPPTTTTTVVDISQPLCAEPAFVPITPDQAAAMSQQQQALAADLNTARSYGAAHAAEFSDVGFAPSATQTSIVAWFTGHRDQHQLALRRLVDHPDLLTVEPAMHNARDADALFKAVQNDPKIQPYLGDARGGGGRGAVIVEFGSDRDSRNAATYAQQKWGRALCITIATHPFPKGAWPDPAVCRDAPLPAAGDVPDVDATLTLEQPTMRRGIPGRATLHLTNRTSSDLTLDSGSSGLTASVVEAGRDAPIGVQTGVQNASLRTFKATPGQTIDVPVIFGTSDCRPNSDYALPRGAYEVVIGGTKFPRVRVPLTLTD